MKLKINMKLYDSLQPLSDQKPWNKMWLPFFTNNLASWHKCKKGMQQLFKVHESGHFEKKKYMKG